MNEQDQIRYKAHVIYDNLPCGIIIYDMREGQIFYVNKTFQKMMGLREDEDFIAEYPGIRTFLGAKEIKDNIDDIEKLKKNGGNISFERHFLARDNKHLYVAGNLSLYPFNSDDHLNTEDKRPLILSAFNNITQRVLEEKAHQKDLERYDVLIAHSGLSVLDLNRKKELLFASPGFSKYEFSTFDYKDIFNPDRQEDIKRCVHPDDWIRFDEFIQSTRVFSPTHAQLRLLMKDGSYRWTDLACTSFFNKKGKRTRQIYTLLDIHARMHEREREYQTKLQFDQVIETIPSGVIIERLSPNPAFLMISNQARRMLDLSEEEYRSLLYGHQSFQTKIRRSDFSSEAAFRFDNGELVTGQSHFIDRKGKMRWLQISCQKNINHQTSEVFNYLTISDITAQIYRERKMRWQEECYRLLSEEAGITTFGYDCLTDQFNYASKSFDEMIERKIPNFLKEIEENEARLAFRKAVSYLKENPQKSYIFEFEGSYRKPASMRWYRATCVAVRDERGEVYRIVGNIADIHYRKLEEIQLRDQLNQDLLTGLLNRHGFGKEVRKALDNDSEHLFILLDVDQFKNINDRWGHRFGDQVLIEIGKRINRFIKKSPYTIWASRFGGDEYTLFYEGLAHEMIEEELEKIRQSLDFHLGQCEVHVSIGACERENKMDFNTLYELADQALYISKSEGGNVIHIA